MQDNNSFKLIQEKFPFLTIISHLGTEHIGIIQNADNLFVSIYIIDMSFTAEMKKHFLECGETWWSESNRKLSINLFLKKQFEAYRKNLKTFARKDTVIVQGPIVNLKDLMMKRLKRRTVQLIRNLP
jgi:hypothetical protein